MIYGHIGNRKMRQQKHAKLVPFEIHFFSLFLSIISAPAAGLSLRSILCWWSQTLKLQESTQLGEIFRLVEFQLPSRVFDENMIGQRHG